MFQKEFKDAEDVKSFINKAVGADDLAEKIERIIDRNPEAPLDDTDANEVIEWLADKIFSAHDQ